MQNKNQPKEDKMIQEIINNQIEKIKLRNRRYKHISKVSHHLYYMYSNLSDKAMHMHSLDGKEFNQYVRDMKRLSSRIEDYKKYISLITFMQK